MTSNKAKDLSSYQRVSWPGNRPGKLVNVNAYTTLRTGGVSAAGYSEYNLATHVGDDLQAVKINRAKLREDLCLPSEPVWLEQVHSNTAITVDVNTPAQSILQADASVSRTKGLVCAVLTADCLPVFFCNQSATEVAVAHAGWRGLHAGIISNTVNAMHSSVDEIIVSLGPAIGPRAFEVGEEVFSAFVDKNNMNKSAFVVTTKGHYLCDIYQLARNELHSLGIAQIAGGNHCTYNESQQFYSYRREYDTGRMASLIWLT
jgi:YfiH family protein